MKNKIEAFYTGGGIYLCTCPKDTKHYYLISSDYINDLALIKGDIDLVDFDNEQDTICFYKYKNELPNNEKQLYEKMLEKLKKEMTY